MPSRVWVAVTVRHPCHGVPSTEPHPSNLASASLAPVAPWGDGQNAHTSEARQSPGVGDAPISPAPARSDPPDSPLQEAEGIGDDDTQVPGRRVLRVADPGRRSE